VPFTIPHSIDTFRSGGGKSLIDVSYAIPLSVLVSNTAEGVHNASSEVGVEIRSLTRETLLSKLDTVSIPVAKGSTGSYTGLYRYVAPADSYNVSMHIRPLGTNFYGYWNTPALVPAYRPTDFSLSDIQLLIPSNQKTAIDFEGIKVVPSPFNRHPRDRKLYIYCQVYGLVKDAEDNTSYQATCSLVPFRDEVGPTEMGATNAVSRPAGIVLAEKGRRGRDESEPLFLTLNTEKIDPGRYRLTVTVTDKNRVQDIVRSRIIELYEP
jgi:hypothetical protein